MTFSIMVIVGTRPEIIKMSPIIHEIQRCSELDLIFIHSGQHYDIELSKRFLEELELPTPDLNMDIGSGSPAVQTSKMLVKFEQIIKYYKPDVVLVEGDTNTVLAAGLASVKLGVPLGHIEAGIRSFDRSMPEEINRRIVAVTAELHFTPSEKAANNLIKEGIPLEKIFITGNSIVDVCLKNITNAKRKSTILNTLGICEQEEYAVVTIHRPENVDKKNNLHKIVDILLSIDDCKLIFPIHPRTKKNLAKHHLLEKLTVNSNIILCEPLGYLDFLRLLSGSTLILTDSGGIQEEAIILKKPCLTLRYNTERPETIIIGSNKLVGLNKNYIITCINKIINDPSYKNSFISEFNPYGDGSTSKHIVQIIKSFCIQNSISNVRSNIKKSEKRARINYV